MSSEFGHLLLLGLLVILSSASANWQEWWTYDGISGPSYWGVINRAWIMCNKGRQQSPINIRPKTLVFDPTLTPVHVDKQPVKGVLYNTGQSLVFKVESDNRGAAGMPINMTGGPLSYR